MSKDWMPLRVWLNTCSNQMKTMVWRSIFYENMEQFHSVSRNPSYEATCTSHRIACKSTFSEPAAGGRGKRRTIAGPICRISPSSEFSDRTAFAFYTFGIGAKKLRNPERNGASYLKCPKSKAEWSKGKKLLKVLNRGYVPGEPSRQMRGDVANALGLSKRVNL